MTISVCVQTSPSGCHSGSCSQPISGRSSGQHGVDHAEVERQREADRRPLGLQQQLFELAPDPLRWQIVERDAVAQRGGVIVQREFEARGKLHGAQHPKAVVAEGVEIDGPQDAASDVFAAVEGILVGVGQRIPENRVHGEVTAAGGHGGGRRPRST
jgi:hypothetical protein